MTLLRESEPRDLDYLAGRAVAAASMLALAAILRALQLARKLTRG